MSDLLIVAPLPIAAVTGNGASLANLLTPDPREVWTSDGSAVVQITIDLGVAATFDTVYLGYVRAASAGFFGVQVDGGALTFGLLAQPRLANRAAQALAILPVPVTGQRVRLTVNFGAATAASAGVAMVGLSFRPTWPQEWGNGRAVIDTGTRDRLQGGSFAIDPGVRKPSWNWTLGDLSDDELATLYALVLDRGQTQPVLVVESAALTDRLCERIHYGVLDKLQPYERRDVGLTRWALTVEDWL